MDIVDASIEVCVDDGNVVQAIYFQTEEMKNTFAAYPELVFIDATYKLNDLRMPVYLMVVEDGNGESEVIGIWVVRQEDNQTIRKMVEIFKKHNDKWDKVECVISDKDMNDFGTFFLICLPTSFLNFLFFLIRRRSLFPWNSTRFSIT